MQKKGPGINPERKPGKLRLVRWPPLPLRRSFPMAFPIAIQLGGAIELFKECSGRAALRRGRVQKRQNQARTEPGPPKLRLHFFPICSGGALVPNGVSLSSHPPPGFCTICWLIRQTAVFPTIGNNFSTHWKPAGARAARPPHLFQPSAGLSCHFPRSAL